jgi:hypothetical protein
MTCQLCSRPQSTPLTPVFVVVLERLKSAFTCSACAAKGIVIVGATAQDLELRVKKEPS